MNPTPEQLAEQHGHAETEALLNMMKGVKTQAARLMLLHALVVQLATSEHPERELAGFSVAILAPLERFIGAQ
jgi:hypothetical protein